MRNDDLVLPIAIMIGLVGVLAVILEFQNIYGGSWSSIGTGIAPLVVMLGVFSIILFLVFRFMKS